jgi:hypothetical protein
MPQTIEVQAFSFDELSDAAKERARDWFRESIDSYDFDCVTEDFVTICDIIGIELDTHNVQLMGGKTRQEPNIYWSVGYCQSDYAAFEGTYDYKATAGAKLREHCNDEKLFRIVDELAAIQTRNGFGLRAVMKVQRDYMTVSECYDRRDEERDLGDDGRDLEELMKDLARWLYDSFRAESDYQYSAEAVDANIEANEYMFDEEGNRHAYA